MLSQELLELEEKAEQLDKQRSKGLSAIRSGYMHGIQYRTPSSTANVTKPL